MSDALSSSISIVAYLALFGGIAVLFLFVNLLVGRFLRPADPHAEKLEIYECGEPTIGSSFVQFDLRFYVVALLFIIFDVEVALFFPWATVFGKSTHLMNEELVVAERVEGAIRLSPDANALYRELGVRHPVVLTALPPGLRVDSLYRDLADRSTATGTEASLNVQHVDSITHRGAKQLAWVTIVDILAFFGVLMVGFLYVWKRGDLDWVRALSQERSFSAESTSGRAAA